MTKTDLANKLRQFHCDLGKIPRVFIDALTDETIIEGSVTCWDCGGRLVSDDDLEQAIEESADADEFLEIIDELSEHDYEDAEE